MSRSRAGRKRPVAPVFLFGWLLLSACQLSAADSNAPNQAISFQLRAKLARLSDQWLVWNTAFLQRDEPAARAAVEDLERTLEDLGMKELPEISYGMIGRGVEAAREGDAVFAIAALDMAERLLPGSAESAFARSRVAWRSGDYARAGEEVVAAVGRALDDSLQRTLWLHNLSLWVMCTLLLTGAATVAVLFAGRGGQVLQGLIEKIGRRIPPPLDVVLAVALILWPFLLIAGGESWIWLVLYWGGLVWPFATRAERWALVATSLVLAFVPLAVLSQNRRVHAATTDEVRVVENVSRGRLYGRLFADLQKLEQTLPDNLAARQFIADAHVRLGQDQVARPLYQALVDRETTNAAALNNLGMFHYYRGETVRAIEFWKRANQAQPGIVEPVYNLSLAYRALLEFTAADRFIEDARLIDPERVSSLVSGSKPAQLVFGGLARRPEIRSALRDAESEGGGFASRELLANTAGAPPGLLMPVFGFLVARLLGGVRTARPAVAGTVFDRLLLWLIPGLAAVEEGSGWRAAGAMIWPAAALAVPLVAAIGYRIPWGYEPTGALVWVPTAVLLAIFYLARLRVVLG